MGQAEHQEVESQAVEALANRDQVALARAAAEGDAGARREVSALVHRIVEFQNQRFCKRYCRDHRYQYRCTLDESWGAHAADAPLCEWGNAGYAWMLDDLTNDGRLRQFEGRGGARLVDYFFRIANSLPFYERWKDWRFGRRTHVPTFVQDIAPDAAQVFWALRAGESVPLIAQRIGRSEAYTDELTQSIVVTLTQRGRLHLLDPPRTVSLVELGVVRGDAEEESEADVASEDQDFAQVEANAKLWQAWSQLDPVEQYVLEAMVIDEMDANDVLNALRKLNISVARNVPAAQTNRQQLYYFRRKAVAKLAELAGLG